MCISGLVAQELSVSGAGPGAQGYFRNYLAFLICTSLISSSQPFGTMPGIQDLFAMLMPQLLLETCNDFPSGAGHPQIVHERYFKRASQEAIQCFAPEEPV